MATAKDPYPPETVEQAHRFLAEDPSTDAINMALEDRFKVAPDPMDDRVYDVLRSGLDPYNGRIGKTVRQERHGSTPNAVTRYSSDDEVHEDY